MVETVRPSDRKAVRRFGIGYLIHTDYSVHSHQEDGFQTGRSVAKHGIEGINPLTGDMCQDI